MCRIGVKINFRKKKKGRKMRNKIIIGVMGVLLSCGGLAQAVPITIEITGNITSVSGSGLPGTVYIGDIFTGTYTYDSDTLDSAPSAQLGEYQYNSPYGITLSLGGYEFKTAPNHVGQFGMWIGNDDSVPPLGEGVWDYYLVRSYQNVSVPSVGFTILSIRWDLWDSKHTALFSDTLPITAPVLTDWNFNLLEISFVGYGLSIYGTVTQAVLVPEPLTGVLMITGVLLLRRKQ